MTAPERMCAPTSEPFSTTTTLVSGESCLSRIAAASPAGPAPTITTLGEYTLQASCEDGRWAIDSLTVTRTWQHAA